MTNPINFIAAASLLLSAANRNPASAFRSPVASSRSSLPSPVRRRRPAHARAGGGPSRPRPSPLGSSPRDDRDYSYYYEKDDGEDDTEGYEIRVEGNNRVPRPATTSFGAENVPSDFRPSNEYLNLVRQPTFGWASQDSGDAGLAIRLAIVYAGFFFLV